MYQIYRIIHDHILPKEIDNNAEYICEYPLIRPRYPFCITPPRSVDVPDVVGYYMNPVDIYGLC